MSNKTDQLTLLGDQDTKYHYDNPDANMFELFDTEHQGELYLIPFECSEFTSLCPKTGQPDFAKIQIIYAPRKKCIESKSLKLYLFAYRNHGAFHEDCINKMANDIKSAIDPLWLRVWGNFTVRGGIAIKPLAFRYGCVGNDLDYIERQVTQYDRLSQ